MCQDRQRRSSLRPRLQVGWQGERLLQMFDFIASADFVEGIDASLMMPRRRRRRSILAPGDALGRVRHVVSSYYMPISLLPYYVMMISAGARGGEIAPSGRIMSSSSRSAPALSR